MATRYKLTIQYDGTDFHGWQQQPDRRTVQGELEQALARLSGESVRVAAAGRTDAGVHAAGQVVGFTLARDWEPARLQRALNGVSGADLSICSVEVTGADFDPRRSASGREYVYRIWNARWLSPFWRRYAWQVPRQLDRPAMAAAAQALIGEHDFSSFRAADCDAEHPRRLVRVSELGGEGELLSYRIEATAFLRHMVRNIAGTLVEVGLGTRPAASMAELLAARDRNLAGATAPARGLCLSRVSYAPRTDRSHP